MPLYSRLYSIKLALGEIAEVLVSIRQARLFFFHCLVKALCPVHFGKSVISQSIHTSTMAVGAHLTWQFHD